MLCGNFRKSILGIVALLILFIPVLAVHADEQEPGNTLANPATTSENTTLQISSTTSNQATTTTTATGSETTTTSTTPTTTATPGPFLHNIKVSSNAGKIKALTDNKTTTVWDWDKNATITIEANKKIAIYIKWHIKPELWTLKAPDGSVVFKGGRQGFLHEFVQVSDHYPKLTMALDNSKGQIADLFVFDAGAVPSWVQRWEPMLDKADMLIYSTHADDEFLWFGGAIPYYAGELKKKVQLAYMVRHGGDEIGIERNHELLDGAWTAGIRNYPMISDFKDKYFTSLQGAISFYKWDAVLDYTVMLIRRFKPDVVLGHDPNGEYGHAAHRLSSKALQEAVYISGDPSKFKDSAQKYGTWNVKKCYLHLYKKNQITMNWDIKLKAFGGKTAMQVAQMGLECHKTQVKKPQWSKVAAKGTPYDSTKFGLYFTSEGPDIKKNDFFENIVPGAIIDKIPTTTSTSGTKTQTTTVTQTTHTDITHTTTTTTTSITTTMTTEKTDVPAIQDEPGNSKWIFGLVAAGTIAIFAGGITCFMTMKNGKLPFFKAGSRAGAKIGAMKNYGSADIPEDIRNIRNIRNANIPNGNGAADPPEGIE